jgi:hypothetical protein
MFHKIAVMSIAFVCLAPTTALVFAAGVSSGRGRVRRSRQGDPPLMWPTDGAPVRGEGSTIAAERQLSPVNE